MSKHSQLIRHSLIYCVVCICCMVCQNI